MNIVDARKYNKLLSLIALLKIKTAGDVFKYRCFVRAFGHILYWWVQLIVTETQNGIMEPGAS